MLGAALREGEVTTGVPHSRHPLGHCFPAPRLLPGAWEAVRPSAPRGCLGSLRLGRATLFLCRRDCSKAANMCVRLFQNPVGPGLWGTPALCMPAEAPGGTWVRSVGRCPASPHHRPPPFCNSSLSFTPSVESLLVYKLSGVSPAPRGFSEPTRRALQQLAVLSFEEWK